MPQKTPFPPNRTKHPQAQEVALRNSIQRQCLALQAHIHLKEGAVPKARHSPIPMPFLLKEPVRQALWEDVIRGIITPVPVGMPTDWCSTMVITAKKNGKPWRTIEYQHLNSQCKWETHHTESLYQLALQVPTTNHLHHGMGKIHVPKDATPEGMMK